MRKKIIKPAFLISHRYFGEIPKWYFEQHFPDKNPRDYIGNTMYLGRNTLWIIKADSQTKDLQWGEIRITGDLSWVARSHEEYKQERAKYYYTVPLDIILMPVGVALAPVAIFFNK